MQGLEKSGSTNLNPMFWWKYVMMDKAHSVPSFCVIGRMSESLIELAKTYPEFIFYLLQTDMDSGIPNYGNIVVRWKYSLVEDKAKGEWWSKIDYLLCSDKFEEDKLEAGLCGVKCLESGEDFVLKVVQGVPLTKVDRIENWEFTKNLLTS